MTIHSHWEKEAEIIKIIKNNLKKIKSCKHIEYYEKKLISCQIQFTYDRL